MGAPFMNQRMEKDKLGISVISTRGRDLVLQRFKISPSGRDDNKPKYVVHPLVREHHIHVVLLVQRFLCND